MCRARAWLKDDAIYDITARQKSKRSPEALSRLRTILEGLRALGHRCRVVLEAVNTALAPPHSEMPTSAATGTAAGRCGSGRRASKSAG